MTLWQLICMSFISDMAKFFCHCYEALIQYIPFISLNKINSQLHVWVLWAYHHVIGRRTYLQLKIIAPCLHTSCFILNWICLVLTTALKITHQKANDNIWHFDLHVLYKLVMWLSFASIVMKLWFNVFFLSV